VFGNTTGIAPGYELFLAYKRVKLSARGECAFDTDDRNASFFYAWDELVYSPADWFHVALVAQRTRAYHTDLGVQRGFSVGVAHEKADFTTCIFNAGWTTSRSSRPYRQVLIEKTEFSPSNSNIFCTCATCCLRSTIETGSSYNPLKHVTGFSRIRMERNWGSCRVQQSRMGHDNSGNLSDRFFDWKWVRPRANHLACSSSICLLSAEAGPPQLLTRGVPLLPRDEVLTQVEPFLTSSMFAMVMSPPGTGAGLPAPFSS